MLARGNTSHVSEQLHGRFISDKITAGVVVDIFLTSTSSALVCKIKMAVYANSYAIASSLI